MARIRSCFSVVRSTTSRPTGTIMAPPMPWMTRAAVNCQNPVLNPHRIEDPVKTAMAATNTVRAPKRSATQPLMGMKSRQHQHIGGHPYVEIDRIHVEGSPHLRQRRSDDRAIQVLHEK